MQVHLVDGTYELFRAFYGAPPRQTPDGREIGATIGLARSMLALVAEGATHVAVAFDHVIESFRNDLFPGYKTGEGIDPALRAQFDTAERISQALGLTVWSMVEFEADDALATGAALYAADPAVERVLVCSPDKDLAQCVQGSRVVCFDRLRKKLIDEAAVIEKFGVAPASIPDWLALVGDAADGIPGIPRWGARAAAAALARYEHIEAIPPDAREWSFAVRGAATLAESLRAHRDVLPLYRTLATLRTDVPLIERAASALEWRGARRTEIEAIDAEWGSDVASRITRWLDAAV